MKKIFLILLIFIPIKIYALSASSYVVMDYDSARVIEGSNIDNKKLIASTTKIMTAIIALENADINQEVEVSSDVLKAYGSAIYIEVGEKLTLKDLLYGLILRSGNDAAIEIARVVSGSMDDFVKLMNEKAIELDMKNTLFINNHGLEDNQGNGNISSAFDMALLMRYALNNDVFKKITSTKRYTVKSSYKTYDWYNKNRLLNEYKYCIGGKTGFTKKARRTLVTAASKDNKTLIIVTLNDPNDFTNHKNLYEENFKKYDLVKILNKNTFKIDNVNYKGNLYIKDDYKILLTKDEVNKIEINYELNEANNYKNNDEIGYALIKLDNKILGKVPIYISTIKEEINEDNKSWLSKFLDFIFFWR